MRISQRLQTLAEFCLPGKEVWDIGADHGQLGVYLLKKEICPRSALVDPARDSARKIRMLAEAMQVPFCILGPEDHPKREGVSFYPCHGQDLRVPLSGNLVIAGMGSHKIMEILHQILLAAWTKQSHALPSRLILAPHRDPQKLQGLLVEKISNWPILYSPSHQDSLLEAGRRRYFFIFDSQQKGAEA